MNMFMYVLCFAVLPLLLMGLLGALLGWFLRGRKRGDLSVEGEGALRAENDELRNRLRGVEGELSSRDTLLASRDTEIGGLKTKLAAGAAAAAAVTGGAALAAKASAGDSVDDDATYALEWRNRYLAARVKYLEGRVSEVPAAKPKTVKPKTVKAKVVKAAAKPKAKAKAAPKPKVLYTDGPTDGTPDDLKVIKGIGPKFESDLNSKGIYYYRQIGNWKVADVKMVEGVIDSIPGRIKRDEWVKQAKGLAKAKPAKAKATKAKAPKAKAKASTKSATLTAAGTTPKKRGPKPGSKNKTKAADGGKPAKGSLDAYHADVLRYHKTADKYVVKAIVDHCGIALRSRDGSLVSCSDQKEKDTVVANWAQKKLGGDAVKAKAAVDAVCTEMKADRFKNRVTFYYLVAKQMRKLTKIK